MNTKVSNCLWSVGLAILATLSPTVHADDVHCPPFLGSETIDGNVVVAAPCELNGTTVKGSVLVYAGGSVVLNAATVIGNLQADDAGTVTVIDSKIGGSVQFDRSVEESAISNSDVTGSIQIKDSRSSVSVDATTIGADLQAFNNSGGVSLTGNTIDGNLQCKENSPAPDGSGNLVSGTAEDQCADIAFGGGSVGGGGSDGSNGSGGSQCNGLLGEVTIDGDLDIAEACELLGTTIDGNVKLFAGGSLNATDIRVIGNVQADSAFEIALSQSVVDGNIQFDNLVGDASLNDNRVGGSIQVNDNGFALMVANNVIGSDVQAFANAGGVEIRSNSIDGNLQCKDNEPAPVGGGNVVGGNAEDQCANLQSIPASAPGTSTAESTNSSAAVAGEANATGGGGPAGPLLIALLVVFGLVRARQLGSERT